MTKQEFLEIQSEVLSGGKSLKFILAELGVPYSTYNYWRNKFTSKDENLPIAPMSIKEPEVTESYSTFENVDVIGVVLFFSNGFRVHFGRGGDHILMELLNKSVSHVPSE
ncbi:hypothetical protein [Bacteroides muris (ex Fokt et al. 2023)]|uniref:Transposase n=1 Tax=Bacteroides muris (ex Fokt et al. 2023) TaxID=2937417 RepID=A0A9X2NV51_9BACE|nr:hypothetical protein [Bacteroides muris (ex Fokt et al. 2023)]MCR6506170.1 hypothetical protein [Bacteroides muris (ex Fokt et al. 2023)]